MENTKEYPVLINLRTKKQLDVKNRRSLKIGWGSGGYDIVLLGSEKGLCCEIICKGKEYTLLPFSVFATIFVNDEEVFGAAKLTHGCKLQFGETNLFKFILPSSQAPPPEKPSRFFQNAKEIEQNFEELRGYEDGNPESEHEWILRTQPEIDDDLLEQLQTPAQIANLASSFISRQLLLLTDLTLSPQVIDQIFKALQHVAEMDDSIVINFIKEFSMENTAGKHHQPGHSALIKLLVDLLKFSMEPVREQVLWIRLLATLSQLPFNLGPMSRHRAAAAVMGSMSVHSDLAEVQEQGCALLAQMATYIPGPNEKAPVHQNAVDVVMLAIEKHQEEPSVLGVACSVLANLIDTMSEVTSKAARCSSSPFEEAEKVVIKTLNILDYIQERALDSIKDVVKNNPKDFTVQYEGSRIISFYERASDITQENSHSNDVQPEMGLLKTEGILKKPSPRVARPQKASVGFTASTKRDSLSSSSDDSSSLDDGDFSDFSDEELNGIKRKLMLGKKSASYEVEVMARDAAEPQHLSSTSLQSHSTVEETPPRQSEKAKGGSQPGAKVSSPALDPDEYVDGTEAGVNRWSGYDDTDIEGALSTIQKEEYENVFSKILEKKEASKGREKTVAGSQDEMEPSEMELEFKSQLVKRKQWKKSESGDTILDPYPGQSTPNRKQWNVSGNSDEQSLERFSGVLQQEPSFARVEKEGMASRETTKNKEVINRICSLWENGKAAQAVAELCSAVPGLLVPLPEDQLPTNYTAAEEPTWLDTEQSICASVLKSFCSDSSKWALTASTKLLPLLERLFERFVLFSHAAESLEIIISRHGSTVRKYHAGELSRKNTKDAEYLRTCYIHLSKIKVKLERIMEKSEKLDSEAEQTLKILHDMLQPFVAKISMV